MSLKYSKSLLPVDSSDISSISDASNIEHQTQSNHEPSVYFFLEIKAALCGWIGSKVSIRFVFFSATTYYFSKYKILVSFSS